MQATTNPDKENRLAVRIDKVHRLIDERVSDLLSKANYGFVTIEICVKDGMPIGVEFVEKHTIRL